GRLVEQDRHVRVQLQDGRGPQRAERAFDEVVHGLRLAATGRHENEMPGLHDGRQPLSQAVCGHGIQVVAEEPGVVPPGLPGQRLDPRPRSQRRTWLVERDVTVGAYAEDLKIDAACAADRVLVGRARGRDVDGQAVGPIYRAGSEVDPGDEHLVDDV